MTEVGQFSYFGRQCRQRVEAEVKRPKAGQTAYLRRQCRKPVVVEIKLREVS